VELGLLSPSPCCSHAQPLSLLFHAASPATKAHHHHTTAKSLTFACKEVELLDSVVVVFFGLAFLLLFLT
jgi:hypothetical protein